MLFKSDPLFVWAVTASMYIGNVICLILNLPLVGVWARIATIPFPILGPLIVVFSVIGAYSIRFLMFDVWVALVLGVVGYLMRKLRFPMAPMVLASVLAAMLETALSQSLVIFRGSLSIFFTRPIACAFMILSFLSIAWGIWLQVKRGGLETVEDEEE